MAHKTLDSQKNTHFLSIETINGIKFTVREIDILACIHGRRTAKKIAAFLQISPKTVENHVRNVMQKLSCNSRERIIDFIEGAAEAPLLRQRYTQLLCAAAFEQALKDAAVQIKKEPLNTCVIIDSSDEESHASLPAELKESLSVLNICVEFKVEGKLKNLSTLKEDLDSHPEDCLLYILSPSIKKEIQESQDFSYIHRKNFTGSNNISLLISNKYSKKISVTNFPARNPQTSEELLHYYYALLEIIKCLYPALKEDEIFSKLKNQFSGAHDVLSLNRPDQAIVETSQRENQKPAFKGSIHSWLLEKWKVSLASFSLILVCLSVGFIFLKDGEYISSNQNRKFIHSDLILPAKHALLSRPELIAEITSKLKGQEGVQIIALTGLAGTGKKTLARQYAKQQNREIVWEINSERKETIMSSFERLAHALSQTDEDKENLKAIQDIKIPGEKENRIIYFVQDRIKDYPNWLLIFYNADDFLALEKQIPHESGWGAGQVIITSTDSNIKNNTHIQEVVEVGELSEQERIELFSKILKKGSSTEWTTVQLKNAKEFLNQIPPFPLDVALAAYYIKETKIPYELYLQYLHSNNDQFNKLQENVLKEISEHEKTRYNIRPAAKVEILVKM